jgi:hypothetical protein
MRILSHRESTRYDVCDLPLFRWATETRLTRGGRYIHRRIAIHASLANVYAEQFGIGRERP